MGDTTAGDYLSIGEVLGLLLEEFPDVTISKIRFLESQGLIEPERTASGYRKFYDHDVQLLRVILAEQKDNFLPLRVIRDRLENGQIDPTGEHLRPSSDADTAEAPNDGHAPDAPAAPAAPDADRTADPQDASVSNHPSARSGHPSPSAAPDARPPDARSVPAAEPAVDDSPAAAGAPPVDPEPPIPQGAVLSRDELCAVVGMTDSEVEDLESFGLVHRQEAGGPPTYGEDAVEIARPAVAFLRAGVDARHLRTFRTAAEREASLYEQLVTPRLRQRNPESIAAARRRLHELDDLGATLRSALIRHALHRPFAR